MILGHFRDLLQPDSPRQGEEDVKTPESSLDSTPFPEHPWRNIHYSL